VTISILGIYIYIEAILKPKKEKRKEKRKEKVCVVIFYFLGSIF
jgi:hypothetical protein